MKYKLLGSAMAVLMLLCALGASAVDRDSGANRYHQHLSAPVPREECGCGGEDLCTHLPIIRIETGGQEIPGSIIRDPEDEDVVLGYTTTETGAEEILVSIETVETEGVWHHASDEADQSGLAWFRIRGNSSRNFPKKNYRIELVADETGTQNLELPLLGMDPDNDWALHGPFLDKTLLRNYVWMNLSAEIMGYAPEMRFCEVLLDGEYIGVYVLRQTITRDEYPVDLRD